MSEYLPGHRVTWLLDADGVSGEFHCEAPIGAECRLQCAENCGSETYPCSSWDEEKDEDREHQLVDQGECNVVLFLSEGTAYESFEGEDCAPAAGTIVLRWSGDHYKWRYPGQSHLCPRCEHNFFKSPDCQRCSGKGRVRDEVAS